MKMVTCRLLAILGYISLQADPAQISNQLVQSHSSWAPISSQLTNVTVITALVAGKVVAIMIEGERVYLRPLTEEDLPKVLLWNLDEDLSEYLDSELPTSLEECKEWHAQMKSDRYAQVFGIVFYHNHLLIGDVELINITWRNGHAELRIRIGEKDFWNQGLGTETLHLLLGYVFYQLKLERIYLRVYETNKRAIRCYRKAGFSFEGKLKRSRDFPDGHDTIILMHILKADFLALEKQWRKDLSRQVG